MRTSEYKVTGMTCEHCVNAVTSELRAVAGVSDIAVDLVAGGASTVTVTSNAPIDDSVIAAAVDEAGYALASPRDLPLA